MRLFLKANGCFLSACRSSVQAAATYRAQILSLTEATVGTADYLQCRVVWCTVYIGCGGSQESWLVGSQLFGLLSSLLISFKQKGWAASGHHAKQEVPAVPGLGSQQKLRTAAFRYGSYCQPIHPSALPCFSRSKWDLSSKGDFLNLRVLCLSEAPLWGSREDSCLGSSRWIPVFAALMPVKLFEPGLRYECCELAGVLAGTTSPAKLLLSQPWLCFFK